LDLIQNHAARPRHDLLRNIAQRLDGLSVALADYLPAPAWAQPMSPHRALDDGKQELGNRHRLGRAKKVAVKFQNTQYPVRAIAVRPGLALLDQAVADQEVPERDVEDGREREVSLELHPERQRQA